MEKGGREQSVLTDESEPARGKDGLRIPSSSVQPGWSFRWPLPPTKRRSLGLKQGRAGTPFN